MLFAHRGPCQKTPWGGLATRGQAVANITSNTYYIYTLAAQCTAIKAYIQLLDEPCERVVLESRHRQGKGQ